MMAWIYAIADYRNPRKEMSNVQTGLRQLKPLELKSFIQVIIEVYYVSNSLLIQRLW